MFWWVVTPILAFYLKMSTGVPIDRISHQYRYMYMYMYSQMVDGSHASVTCKFWILACCADACDARCAAWRAILVTNAPPRVGAAARL